MAAPGRVKWPGALEGETTQISSEVAAHGLVKWPGPPGERRSPVKNEDYKTVSVCMYALARHTQRATVHRRIHMCSIRRARAAGGGGGEGVTRAVAAGEAGGGCEGPCALKSPSPVRFWCQLAICGAAHSSPQRCPISPLRDQGRDELRLRWPRRTAGPARLSPRLVPRLVARLSP